MMYSMPIWAPGDHAWVLDLGAFCCSACLTCHMQDAN